MSVRQQLIQVTIFLHNRHSHLHATYVRSTSVWHSITSLRLYYKFTL